MWDGKDYGSRWIQGICAIFLALFTVIGGYVVLSHLVFFIIIGGIPVITGSAWLTWRCAYYALTGKNNVNRDYF